MIKILKIFFVSLILIFFVSLTYLSIFGIETNKFNKLISDKIRNIHPEIDVKLKKIKLTIELFELKVLIVTKNPVIEIANKKLNLKKVSTTYDIKSFAKKDFGITNLNFKTDYNEVKNVQNESSTHKKVIAALYMFKQSGFRILKKEYLFLEYLHKVNSSLDY